MIFTLHTSQLSPHPHTLRGCSGNGIRFAASLCGTNVEGTMTRTQWLLLGAVLLGLAVGLYFLFFCPVECT